MAAKHPRPPLPPGYPVVLVLSGRPCLVVGGGPVARRKVVGLLAAGARVRVVAPAVVEELAALPVERCERAYEARDLEGVFLAIAATGRPEVDRAVFADAEAARVLVNAADDPAACSVVLPAVARDGPVSIAVSTSGRSPALAGILRDRLAEAVGPGVGEVAEALGAARRSLHQAGRSTEHLAWAPLVAELLERARAGAGPGELAQSVGRFLADLAGGPGRPSGGPRRD